MTNSTTRRIGIIGASLSLVAMLATSALADDPMPPNLCGTHVAADQILEWQGGGIDPDPIGIEWWVDDADGNVIAYGEAPTLYKGLVRATTAARHNSYCATYQDKDMVLPW